ncbi:MAG: hypothetical protein R2932_30395 [Caldilineaceae bacterium]
MKTNQSRRRRILSLMVLCAVTVALGIKPVAAQSIQPAQTTMDIPCTTTPFGRHLALGKEQELFASVDDMAAPQPHTLNWAVQDRNDAGQLHAIAFADVGVTPHHISALAATAADLDGDGKSEFVQGFTDSSGQSQLVVHRDGQSDLTHTETVSNQISRALAAGDILGQDNGAEQLVVASRGADNVLNVAVYSDTVASGIGAPVAIWRSATNGRGQGTKIHVAVGNLNNNRTADIVISLLQADGKTAQMITLEYQPNFQQGSGANLSQNLQERATTTYFVGTGTVGPQDLQMTLADLSGSGQDRVVLAWDQAGGLGGLSPMLALRTFDVLTINGTVQFVNREQWSTQSNSLSFALAAGDLNGDFRDEIVVGYDVEGNSVNGLLNVTALDLVNQNTPNPTLDILVHWQDGNDGRNMTNRLALAVGDLNKDNRAEIAAAFTDSAPGGYQLLYLTFLRLDANPTGANQLESPGCHD